MVQIVLNFCRGIAHAKSACLGLCFLHQATHSAGKLGLLNADSKQKGNKQNPRNGLLMLCEMGNDE